MGSIQQEEIIINIYEHNCIKQLLLDLKGEIDYNTTIMGNFTSPHSSMDKWPEQKVNKEIIELKLDYGPNKSKRHLQDISTNSCRIHILLISIWHILQDRPYYRQQNQS